MSKSKRERNYRREEARFSDGVRNGKDQKSRVEKKVKNLFRSNNFEELMKTDFNA